MAEREGLAATPTPDKGEPERSLTDRFGRTITYVRLSVTDRCNLRCRYCMAERMEFLPRRDLLTLEELAELADALIARGVRRIRLTGGEPLVRRGIVGLAEAIGQRIGNGLDELTMTTNATQLAPVARDLLGYGIRRLNISLDSLDSRERLGAAALRRRSRTTRFT
jgi:cyclic pyranopterin phosphate synthase